jgi:acetyltransferase-like isoleucine patch superfamily enzyme
MLADDHAFADGPVFQRVASEADARKSLEATVAVATAESVRHLADLWRRFDAGAKVGDGVRLGVNARLINGGDPGLVTLNGPSAIRGIIRAEAGGRIEIGRFCYIGDDVILSARHSIQIGDATLLGHGVQVFDNDSHPTDAWQREVQFRRMLGDKSVTAPMDIAARPISIGRRCWIGLGTLVMKGVTIGDDTVVAAASVVTGNLPAGVVAAGNPARVVRELTPP